MPFDELLKPILRSPIFPDLLKKLNAVWEEEKNRRLEFYNWITPSIKAEFIEGEIVVHSPVRRKHNLISGQLYSLLHFYVVKKQLGFVGIEKIMIRLTRNDYEPDICFFGRAKSEKFTNEQTLFPAPDFVVEILSPSTETRDRGVKFEDYALHAVKEYWLIDPATEVIEQYTLNDDEYVLANKLKKGSISSLAVPGFIIPVAAVFSGTVYQETLTSLG